MTEPSCGSPLRSPTTPSVVTLGAASSGVGVERPMISKVARKLRTACHAALALTPRAVKLPIYRHLFGFDIADDAKIGCSILDVDHLSLGPGATIGHGNWFSATREVRIDEGADVGFLNLLRGGDTIHLHRYAQVFRFNVLNSILDPETVAPTDARLILGPGACVVSGHRFDFTDRIQLGKNVIIAGRNSSLWTHNRQVTSPIEIADYCYLGSEVRLAPGARLGEFAVLSMGSVLAGDAEGHTVHGGVPARPIRPTNQDDERALRKKTRPEIPEGEF